MDVEVDEVNAKDMKRENSLQAEGLFRTTKDKEINLKTDIVQENSFIPDIDCKSSEEIVSNYILVIIPLRQTQTFKAKQINI